jgi:hypothetical protein
VTVANTSDVHTNVFMFWAGWGHCAVGFLGHVAGFKMEFLEGFAQIGELSKSVFITFVTNLGA